MENAERTFCKLVQRASFSSLFLGQESSVRIGEAEGSPQIFSLALEVWGTLGKQKKTEMDGALAWVE